MTRGFTLIIGLVLALGAFLGLLFVGAVVNPSPYPVVVVIKDVEPGEILSGVIGDMVNIDPQMISPQVAEQYVLESQLADYAGKVVTRRLYPGQPLMHYDVVAEENPLAYRRLALVLEDPGLAAIVLPVEETSVVDAVMIGDWVAIVWSIGEDSAMLEMGGLLPESGVGPGPYGLPDYVVGPGGELVPLPTEEAEGIEEEEAEGVETAGPAVPGEPPPEVEALLGEEVRPGADLVPEVELPLAKMIVNAARVIGVRREQEPNPAYTGEPGESSYVEGRVIGLELAVPLDELEVIRFVIANGEYSVAILSPNADVEAMIARSSVAVMWSDVEAYIAADRMRALGVYSSTETIRPMGAVDVYEDVLHPHLVETPEAAVVIPPREPTATPQAGAEEGEEGEMEVEATRTPGPLPTATPASAGREIL